MPTESGGICERLTDNLLLGCLQGGVSGAGFTAHWLRVPKAMTNVWNEAPFHFQSNKGHLERFKDLYVEAMTRIRF